MNAKAVSKKIEEISPELREPKAKNFLKELPEKLGFTAKSISVYGAPVERGDLTVIPVSKISYGFGGGFGKQKGEEGGGGGGGLITAPVGYIEIKNGEARFRRIVDFSTIAPLIATGSIALLTVVWGIGKLVKISKKRK